MKILNIGEAGDSSGFEFVVEIIMARRTRTSRIDLDERMGWFSSEVSETQTNENFWSKFSKHKQI
jgi:hypothetical protein